MPSPLRVSRAAILLVVLALVVSACAGGATDTETSPGPEASPSDTEATDESADAATESSGIEPSTDAAGVEVSGEQGAKPEVALPGGEPPTDLVVVDLIEGDGEEIPAGVTVTTDYVGVSWLNEGQEFDASWDRGEPTTFPLSGVIPGWTDGIPGMREGGRRLLIIPPEQAYGSSPPPGSSIAPDDTLVFVIDMVSFEPPPEPVEAGTDDAGVEVEGELAAKPEITLPGGEPPTDLLVVDIVEGDGEVVAAGATVTTGYVGVSWTNDGAEFDSSWDRGQPATFPLSGVIEGWTRGIPGMRVGGRRLLIIPPEQAYGPDAPSDAIAANDTLVFVIDLVEIVQ